MSVLLKKLLGGFCEGTLRGSKWAVLVHCFYALIGSFLLYLGSEEFITPESILGFDLIMLTNINMGRMLSDLHNQSMIDI